MGNRFEPTTTTSSNGYVLTSTIYSFCFHIPHTDHHILSFTKHSSTNPTHFPDQSGNAFLSPFALLKFFTFAFTRYKIIVAGSSWVLQVTFVFFFLIKQKSFSVGINTSSSTNPSTNRTLLSKRRKDEDLPTLILSLCS